MSTKNLGAGVSGYLDPEGRNYETVVYQASKPVLDKELNLVQDVEQDIERRFRQRHCPSGWLSEDVLNTQGTAVSGIFTVSAVANELKMPQDLRALVNGWLIRVAHTNANGDNRLDLGAGPAGAGARRTDLVILEVWLRLLSATPSTDGKSSGGRIWRNGNVKVPGADDAVLNFADDLLDGAVGSETTKRVQIQYRLGAISGVDVFAFPYGLDDPAVVARSVPAAAASPDGNATAFTYTNQSTAGDPGLWRAGDGNPANTIGSVDGYMYAIPLMGVFRRNTTAFARNTNHNGGVATPGPSDRPDGLFHDILNARDVRDLRMAVNPGGWNYQEVLEKNWQYLLDNSLTTEIELTPIGAGVHGAQPLWADEIGVLPGDGTTTGDTPGAEFIGEFDAARRRFSDRAVIEVVSLRYTPADGSGGGPNWALNDEITIDPTALPIYPYSAFNWASRAPSNVSFLGILNASFIGVVGADRTALVSADRVVTGLGGVPQGSVTFDIGTVPAGVTDEDLYIHLIISYPKGQGLTKTPKVDLGAAGLVVNNPGQLPAGAPVLFDQFEDRVIDPAHRELFLTYRALNQTDHFAGPNSGSLASIVFRERVLSISAITLNGGAYGGSITISADGLTGTLTGPALVANDDLAVTFKAVRPLPQNGEQITLFYVPVAPQTAREALLGTSITVVPKHISPFLYVMTVGSGSQDEAYPFPVQYTQMPGVYPSSAGAFAGDHELDGASRVWLEDASFATGFLKTEAIIPYAPNPDEVIFDRAPGDVDAEGRSFFKQILTANIYLPNAFGRPLANRPRRRVFLPMLAELAADSTLGRKGQLVMVVIGSYLPAGTNEVSVLFDTNLPTNLTAASVYRVRGNLLNRRSS